MKYKVGNKVRIKSIDWYNKNKNEYGDIDCGAYTFTYGMTKFCGKIVTILHCYNHGCYTIKEDDNDYTFTSKMIEGLAEEGTPKSKVNDLKYPKSYEECIGKLPINWDGKVEGYKCDLLAAFQKLLICRDVYWTIAGEEIWNTSKPWNPNCHGEIKYTIEYYDGIIINHNAFLDNRILAFPTAEMRDAFKENFKELIELCKELL